MRPARSNLLLLGLENVSTECVADVGKRKGGQELAFRFLISRPRFSSAALLRSRCGDEEQIEEAETGRGVRGILPLLALHGPRVRTLVRRSCGADVRRALATIYHDHLSRHGVRVGPRLSIIADRQAQSGICPLHLPPFL
jgi:hypothetical protein